MSHDYSDAISALLVDLKKQEQEVLDSKQLINRLCKKAGKAPMFSDADIAISSGPALSIRRDQFYGQPLASCLRQILEMRQALNQGPATVNELYDALSSGNYAFETKNDENAKRGLRISLMKNTAQFHKLPSGTFGLIEWYPSAKRQRAKATANGAVDEPTEDVGQGEETTEEGKAISEG